MTYFFIIGNNPTLSIAEIVYVLSAKIKKQNIKFFSQDIFIVEFSKKIDTSLLQKQLGGTIKIGKIVGTSKISDIHKAEQSIVEKITTLLPHNRSKIYFGFSIYSLDGSRKLLNPKRLALAVKSELKKQGIASRWVVSKEGVLSSVIVQKNKLLTQGAEFVLFIEKSRAWIGKTLTCQEFEQYSFYDFSRPYRAIEKGMMPPKLAKIMINFSGVDKKSTLLDPFCGSGTILQQAILMGYTNVIGTDIDQKAVDNSKKNLQWLVKNKELRIKNEELRVIIQKCDVKKLDRKISLQSVDVIITEPYLGPLRFKISDLRFQIDELSRFYTKAFKVLKKVLKTDGKIVIIFPVFSIKNKLHFLPILDKLKENGWEIKAPLPNYLLKEQTVDVTQRNSIIYSRPDQKILREILIFTRN